METIWSRIADAVAAQGGTPRRWASSAIPAIAQIFPGMYLPMLEMTQTRAASHQPSSGPHPASILRHDSISRAYVKSTSTRLAATQAGLKVSSRDDRRTSSQFAAR